MSSIRDCAPRVCILTSVHGAFDTRIFHKQAKSLAKAGYEVTLVAQHGQDEVVDGVKILALPKPRNRFMRMLGGWRVFNLAYKRKAGVYHFHDPELLAVGLLLKLLTKAKVIYDVHEDYPQQILSKYWIPRPLRGLASWAFGLVEKAASRRLDCIVTATEGITQKFKGGTIITIMNYPVLEVIAPTRGHALGVPTLIYVGALTRERGISEIIEAMGHVDSSAKTRLQLVGRFVPESYAKSIKHLWGFERVQMQGWVEPQQAWLMMSRATAGIVCLHPLSRYVDSMPIKLFEYMAAGIPVIASDFPSWKEIVEGNNCGITVDPLDPKDIARAMQYLIGHPDEARTMGQNGREAVLDKYNWESESRKLLGLYDDLLKEGV